MGQTTQPDPAGRLGWEAVAYEWSRHVREGRDATYAWNWPAFVSLLPPPGRCALDLGCGEGRCTRDLAARGYRVIGCDASPTLIELARRAEPEGDYRVADAARLPLPDNSVDLVVAFMVLQDIADLDRAVAEVGRVLVTTGSFCFAVVHPIASAGEIEGDDERFVVRRTYAEPRAVARPLGDSSVEQFHRPLEAYSIALEANGFRMQALRELPTRRRAPGRLPIFLHVRAVGS